MPRTFGPFAAAFAELVPTSVRMRGEAMLRDGRVSELHGSFDGDTVIEAKVHDAGRTYWPVLIDDIPDEGAISYECSCTACARDGAFCSHLWATLLAAEADDRLGEPPVDPGSLSLLPERAREDVVGGPGSALADEILQQLVERRQPQSGPQWERTLKALSEPAGPSAARPRHRAADFQQVLYIPSLQRGSNVGLLAVEVATRQRKKNGEWGMPRFEGWSSNIRLDDLDDPRDVQILTMLYGAAQSGGFNRPASTPPSYGMRGMRYSVPPGIARTVARMMAQTGRLMFMTADASTVSRSVQWDDAGPWRFVVTAGRTNTISPDDAENDHGRSGAKKTTKKKTTKKNNAGKTPGSEDRPDEPAIVLRGILRRGEAQLPLDRPTLIAPGGVVLIDEHIAELDDGGAFEWIDLLRSAGELIIPERDLDEALDALTNLHALPPIEWPDDLPVETVEAVPTPRLTVHMPRSGTPKKRSTWLDADVAFDYAGALAQPRGTEERRNRDAPDPPDPSSTPATSGPADAAAHDGVRRIIRRSIPAEDQAFNTLYDLGLRDASGRDGSPGRVQLPAGRLPEITLELGQRGWRVEAHGKPVRTTGHVSVNLTSGIDWFDLHGSARFDDAQVDLPELLKALRRGEQTVTLDDGTLGLLPEEWMKKYGVLAGLGQAEGDGLRFRHTQVSLLDALLATMPEATCDETFARAREQLKAFEGIKPTNEPSTFYGTLRPYQREGLGWLHFLQQFRFGGCLADDMGLGKTVQVLALLEARRRERDSAPDGKKTKAKTARKTQKKDAPAPLPSLVVAPRSLVFNWQDEAARFTPDLRVLDYTGADRPKDDPAMLAGYDLVLTTYGTLRRDAPILRTVRFDYAILDEAQAIKNADTAAAKAARLLQADHRLALSGTPIENHLGELWSIFEFLNPGMLGASSVLGMNQKDARKLDSDTQQIIARALRPFILRRTKSQVARDLPDRIEQTISCELKPSQRRLYNELRDHYRRALLGMVDEKGLAKTKFQVLEALLRLRQAACHPGLIDRKHRNKTSAKIDALLPQLDEVMQEGHKALVFSQFTSMLDIVRDRLDRRTIPYAYLDGKTTRRNEVVEHFQTDPDCRLFLISLKAGGLGLNLTAAEYVFLLDPWWNPAVEAQAIDRAHRIGQTRQVCAYRLIARDTVEERVLELQQTKRELAEAIISEDNSLIRNLQREDLELLLA